MPLDDYAKFLHPVGTSTFKYGVTIPVEAQTERMRAIEKGGKAPVTIMIGSEEPVVAEIRRLNNKPGHLQFRYENKAQEYLRRYLLGIFGSQTGQQSLPEAFRWTGDGRAHPCR